jgi:hypothetical protein
MRPVGSPVIGAAILLRQASASHNRIAPHGIGRVLFLVFHLEFASSYDHVLGGRQVKAAPPRSI